MVSAIYHRIIEYLELALLMLLKLLREALVISSMFILRRAGKSFPKLGLGSANRPSRMEEARDEMVGSHHHVGL